MKTLSKNKTNRDVKFVGMIITFLAFANLHCAQQTNFAGSELSSTIKGQAVLAASNLSLSTTASVPLHITKASIFAAVTGASLSETLTLTSVSLPPAGESLTDAGDHFVFSSPKVDSIALRYIVSDSNGAQVSAFLNIKIVPAGNATGSYYACASGKLYQLSTDNQSVLSIVPTTFNGKELDFNDIAINANGDMYAKDLDKSGIYKLNVATGVATQIVAVVPNSSGFLAGLTFLADGRLATVQSDGAILAFDLSTLKTSVFEKTNYTMLGGDFKALPDGFIYWTVANASSQNCRSNSSGTQALVRLDPVTGAAIEIGCLDQPSIYGLGFAHGNVYGFTGAGSVLQINVSNAHTTVVGTSPYEYWGAASNPALW